MKNVLYTYPLSEVQVGKRLFMSVAPLFAYTPRFEAVEVLELTDTTHLFPNRMEGSGKCYSVKVLVISTGKTLELDLGSTHGGKGISSGREIARLSSTSVSTELASLRKKMAALQDKISRLEKLEV